MFYDAMVHLGTNGINQTEKPVRVIGYRIDGKHYWLATDRFVFEGFLPRKGSGRSARLAEVAAERRTVVLFEAPHRLGRTLVDLRDACGADRRVAVARELTKKFEQVWRGTLGEAAANAAAGEPRGEHVVVVAGAPEPAPAGDDVLLAALDRLRAGGTSTRDAVAEVARDHGEHSILHKHPMDCLEDTLHLSQEPIVGADVAQVLRLVHHQCMVARLDALRLQQGSHGCDVGVLVFDVVVREFPFVSYVNERLPG